MSFKVSESASIISTSSSENNYIKKNTVIISVLSDQEFISTDYNYLIWVEVTCFREDEIKVIVDDNIIFNTNIYNNDQKKKTINLICINKYIQKHSSVRLQSNSPLSFRLHFSNVLENLEHETRIVKERNLTDEEYESVFNNNNYLDLLEYIFD